VLGKATLKTNKSTGPFEGLLLDKPYRFLQTIAKDSSRGPILNTLENSTMSALQRQNDELLQNVPADSDCTRRGETEQVILNEQLGRIPMHLYFE
jgi:hypothetical protein